MSDSASLATKFVEVSRVYESACFLFNLGLLIERPEEIVKRYIVTKPEIKEFLERTK